MANAAFGLPPLEVPAANPMTPDCIELGKKLFSDRALSRDGDVACANCHAPDKAFGDALPVAVGTADARGTRNAPSLLNVTWQSSLFWDGRADTLEAQATKPLLNPFEHGLANEDALLRAVRNSEYQAAFARAFPEEPSQGSVEQISKALACYERTLVAGNSPFDRYQFGGDKTAMSDSAVRGLELFRGRAGCATCHRIGSADATFTDGKFHRRGIGLSRMRSNLRSLVARTSTASAAELDRLIIRDGDVAQLGRYIVTGNPKDIGSFKTTGLRNVALTGPYMHDGSIKTLEEAVLLEAYYGARDAAEPVMLSVQQTADLVEFLKALTSPHAAPAR